MALAIERIKGARLKLKVIKWRIFFREISFLDQALSSNFIQDDPMKVAHMQPCSTPQNATEPKSFLELVPYYWRLTENFAKVAGLAGFEKSFLLEWRLWERTNATAISLVLSAYIICAISKRGVKRVHTGHSCQRELHPRGIDSGQAGRKNQRTGTKSCPKERN